MSTLKYTDKSKIALIVLALTLMLLAEPVLAKKARTKSSESSRGRQTKQQVQKAPAAPKNQRSPNVRNTTPKITSSQAAKSQTRLSNSRQQNDNSSTRQVTNSVRQPGRITTSRTPTLPSRSATNAPRSFGSSLSEKKEQKANSNTAQQVTVRPGNSISPGSTHSIGSSINNNKATAATMRKQPVINLSSRQNLNITKNIGDQTDSREPSISTAPKQSSVHSSNRINQSKTSRIASAITKGKTLVANVKRRLEQSSNRPSILVKAGSNRTKKPSISLPDKQSDAIQGDRIKSDENQHNSGSARDNKLIVNSERKPARDVKQQLDIVNTEKNNDKNILRNSREADKAHTGRFTTGEKFKEAGQRAHDRLLPSERLRKAVREDRKPMTNTKMLHNFDRREKTSIYHHDKIKRVHRYEHVYRDYRDRICHKIVQPKYRFVVHYSCGPRLTFRYVYPYYLRRYIFVDLGGYWPVEYSCVRYYWYGCHPYWWYGYYPIAREVQTETYNYYTYNYYYDTDGTVVTQPTELPNGIQPVDHTTFADVREKLAQEQAAEPDEATLADVYFDEAVKAFEADDYQTAIEKFTQAMELAPDDMILPFAYSQVLFANEQYSEAAEILRAALIKVTPEKEGVFYPRGLYADEEVLFEQIDRLTEKAEQFTFDANLQLLLGYQLLGIGEIDKALEPLQRASEDLENENAAKILLELLIKIKTSESKPEDANAVKAPMESNVTTEVQTCIPSNFGKTIYITALGALTAGASFGGYYIWC